MKKISLILGALALTLVALPLFSAFEAHVINVTATIENALFVPIKSLDFGTVFPQERLDQTFGVRLSDSFQAEARVDDIDYFIRQKPKCWDGNVQNPTFGTVVENGSGGFRCADAQLTMLPLLCPYLSKHEISSDGLVTENDSAGINAFHGATSTADWTLAMAKSFDVKGHLAKAQQDLDDIWNIDLKAPCFAGNCAQDWESFVLGINPTANPAQYIQPKENEHKLFGCDLWLEVFGISLPGFGCKEELDMMLVLDRSGSIGGDEATLKAAANAFVTALAPTALGVHIGQSSFATTGTLDLHLTGTEANVHTAINALVIGGFTNLKEGIELATAELDNTHVDERPAVADVMVIITDGNPNRPSGDVTADKAAAKTAADAARAAGIEVFVVGVGTGVDATYLTNDIANDAPPTHYFSAATYGDLETVLENLVTCTP